MATFTITGNLAANGGTLPNQTFTGTTNDESGGDVLTVAWGTSNGTGTVILWFDLSTKTLPDNLPLTSLASNWTAMQCQVNFDTTYASGYDDTFTFAVEREVVYSGTTGSAPTTAYGGSLTSAVTDQTYSTPQTNTSSTASSASVTASEAILGDVLAGRRYLGLRFNTTYSRNMGADADAQLAVDWVTIDLLYNPIVVAEASGTDTHAAASTAGIVKETGGSPIVQDTYSGETFGYGVFGEGATDGHWWVTADSWSSNLRVVHGTDPFLFGSGAPDWTLNTLATGWGAEGRQHYVVYHNAEFWLAGRRTSDNLLSFYNTFDPSGTWDTTSFPAGWGTGSTAIAVAGGYMFLLGTGKVWYTDSPDDPGSWTAMTGVPGTGAPYTVVYDGTHFGLIGNTYTRYTSNLSSGWSTPTVEGQGYGATILGDGTVLAVDQTGEKVWRTTDLSGSWTSVDLPGLVTFISIVPLAHSGALVYESGGRWWTFDSGATWIRDTVIGPELKVIVAPDRSRFTGSQSLDWYSYYIGDHHTGSASAEVYPGIDAAQATIFAVGPPPFSAASSQP